VRDARSISRYILPRDSAAPRRTQPLPPPPLLLLLLLLLML